MELSVVIPFYNEEDNVRDVLESIDSVLKGTGIDYEIIPVNNGSLDRTGEILQGLSIGNKRLKIVTVDVNEGYGLGIREGLKAGSGRYIGFMCGDNQVEPDTILAVYRKAKEENLDLCKVERIKRYDGLSRRVISFFYNIICPALFGIKSTDLNGTPKVFRKEIYDKLGIISKRWFIDGEIMIRFVKLKCKIGSIPVEFKRREKGVSKVNIKAVWEFVIDMAVYKLRGGI